MMSIDPLMRALQDVIIVLEMESISGTKTFKNSLISNNETVYPTSSPGSIVRSSIGYDDRAKVSSGRDYPILRTTCLSKRAHVTP